MHFFSINVEESQCNLANFFFIPVEIIPYWPPNEGSICLFFYYKPVMCFQYEIKNYEITKQLLSKFLQSLSAFTKLWIENGTFLNVKCMSVIFFMYMPLSMFRNSNCIENVKFYHLWMAGILTPFNTKWLFIYDYNDLSFQFETFFGFRFSVL